MLIRPLLRPLRRLTPPLWRRALALQTFPVPEMGDSITEGTILEFAKKVGDHVALEEMVASVETDKVTVEVRAPAAGTITKLFASVDDTVIVGTDFMEIDVGVGEASAAAPAAAAASPAVAAAPPEAAASTSLTGVYQFGRSTRNHPGGRPSLMKFPPRGAAAAAAAAAAPAQSAAPAAAKPAGRAAPKVSVDTVRANELPAKFRRPRMSEEEMDAVNMGGAGYEF